jgi:hypothetical protein
MKTKKEYLIKCIKKVEKELCDSFKDEINDIPENKKCKFILKNAYTISSSELFSNDNWSPQYHTFRQTTKFLINKINESGAESILNKLHTLKERDYLEFYNNKLKIHPVLKTELLKLI